MICLFIKMFGLYRLAQALFLIITVVSTGVSQSFDDRKDALVNLAYDRIYNIYRLRPVALVNDTLTVNIDLNIVGILDFDEQNGYIEISGYMDMDWEASLNAYEQKNTKTNFTDLVYNSVFWKPPIIHVNTLKNSDEIGTDERVMIRYNFQTGQCSWRPWIFLRSACTPDVKFYPFDKQSCSFKFAASGYNSSELLLTPKSSAIIFNFFEENGEWNVNDTTAQGMIENNISILEYTITVTRRPLYYVLNILSPVILINLLNVFVFLLPGERVGFAMTCFLSDMVFLGMIMAILPTSAAPISYLSYYTFVMMVFSAGMALATVISLRIHHKSENDKLPSCLTTVFNCCTSDWCTDTSEADNSKREPDWSSTDNVQESGTTQSEKKKLTWKKVASFVDIAFFLGFLGGQVFYSVAYLVPLILNA